MQLSTRSFLFGTLNLCFLVGALGCSKSEVPANALKDAGGEEPEPLDPEPNDGGPSTRRDAAADAALDGSAIVIPNACSFETRTFYSQTGIYTASSIETITSNGKIYYYQGDTRLPLPSGLDGGIGNNTLAAAASWLAAGPCVGIAAGACRLDTHLFYYVFGGTGGSLSAKIESATAYGKSWNWQVEDDNTRTADPGQTAVPLGSPRTGDDRYNPADPKAGPCKGHLTDCVIDTRTFYRNISGQTAIESVTAYGKYYNYSGTTLLGVGTSSDTTTTPDRSLETLPWLNAANGPCKYKTSSVCKLDTRTFAGNLESVTAYGRFWNWSIDPTTFARTLGATSDGVDLKTHARYNAAGNVCGAQ